MVHGHPQRPASIRPQSSRRATGTWGGGRHVSCVLVRACARWQESGDSGDPGGMSRMAARGGLRGPVGRGLPGESDMQFWHPCTKGCMMSSLCTPKQVHWTPVHPTLSKFWVHCHPSACHIVPLRWHAAQVGFFQGPMYWVHGLTKKAKNGPVFWDDYR